MEGKRLLLGDCGVNQLRGGCSIRGRSLPGERTRSGLAEERWRDGGERGIDQTNQGQKIKEKEERRTEFKRQYEQTKKERALGAGGGVLGSVRQIINEIGELLQEAELNGGPTRPGHMTHHPAPARSYSRKAGEVLPCRAGRVSESQDSAPTGITRYREHG